MKRSTLYVGLSLLVVAFIAIGFVAWRVSHASKALATLEAKEGSVERDLRESPGQWAPAALGVEFSSGDALRTAVTSAAVLALDDGSKLRVKERTVIRFMAQPPSKSTRAPLAVEAGEAIFEAGSSELLVWTAEGLVHIERGSRVLVKRTDAGVRLEVHLGRAVLESLREKVEIPAGRALLVALGAAVLEPETAVPNASAANALTRVAEASAADTAVDPNAPSADFGVVAGENVVVHDPAPPTRVRISFHERCPSGGTIRLSPQRAMRPSAGRGSTVLELASGRYEYELRCLDQAGPSGESVARGVITVLHDAGTRPVPKTAPRTQVEADGRSYSVMYQNQLPSVAVLWSKAPDSAASFKLHQESAAGTKVLSLSAPEYVFKAGTLAEGQHTFYFEGGGKLSRRTSVRIRFDNSAPTASLSTPTRLQRDADGKLTIAGTAQPGWTVELEGARVAQDDHSRFSQRIALPAGESVVALKLSHPSRGTQVYLRRVVEP